ncbi:type I restriction endonuclease [Desulfosporosinus nitroreducens]|uniref:Type I restriction enzyme HsdR N-terminal domain-containing protein n=1 Tax=Desulfosporosinus nitroreducens TaxID=2018668 RepID=A0ABT8QKU7_9FIRM|nr:type I restriction endonuclease [Desulfosporosinus nitroreducens]MDO0821953.1 type I restriction enzyme HsdR N-terminal domain-containing protein [Desulfosporosinus nitroreducens]
MNKEIRFNILKDFNYTILDDPEYGEDSVREEIIFPIIRSLGYSSDGNYRIIRSRKLLHPFVSIGSQQKKINIIPDYIMVINGKPSWIMEAKGPNQDILNTKHAEQAYSYAIHSEIRAQYYALCNGREFLIYHVSEYKPMLHFNIRQLPFYWGQLTNLLSPEKLYKNINHALSKDFGLHLKRMGFDRFKRLIFPHVPIPFIHKINNDLFSFGCNIVEDETTYCVSYDFNNEVLLQLQGKVPDEALTILKKPVDGERIEVQFADAVFYVNIECNLDGEIQENEDEVFLPLTIKRIIK